MTKNELAAAYAAKLASSCLTTKHGKQLKMEPMMSTEVEALRNRARATWPVAAGMHIPYFDLNSRPTKFWRLRYLEDPRPTGFAQATTGKVTRYVQPPGTVNEVYMPPLLTVPWKAIAEEPQAPIVITEGELKAAAVCAVGIPCLGLGGVFNYGAKKLGLSMLPVFEEFEWAKRQVYVIYDSDSAENAAVRLACIRLVRELAGRGAIVKVGEIPSEAGEKVGLDDLVLKHGGAEGVYEVMENAVMHEEGLALAEMDEQFIYVMNPGLVIDIKLENQHLPVKVFQTNYQNKKFVRRTPNPTKKDPDNVEEKICYATKEWLESPTRRQANKMVYLPGAERPMVGCDYNMWTGWKTVPKKGDVRMWTQLLDYAMRMEEPEHRKWLEQWLAYPIQHPGTKLKQGVVMFGAVQGTGKTLIGITMMRIYGNNSCKIEESDLSADFNEWAVNKQFVMGEEITSGEQRKSVIGDRIKNLITQEEIKVNKKFISTFFIQDCINYWFTTNHPDAFMLEDTDRRLFVNEFVGPPLDKEKFYNPYEQALLKGELAEAIHYHLLHLDLTGFDPNGHAPMTKAKRAMMHSSLTDMGAWVRDLRDRPATVKAVGKDLWSTPELVMLYNNETGQITGPSAQKFGQELRRAGIPVAGGGQVRLSNGTAPTLNIINNTAKWVAADKVAIVKEYEKGLTKNEPEKRKPKY